MKIRAVRKKRTIAVVLGMIGIMISACGNASSAENSTQMESVEVQAAESVATESKTKSEELVIEKLPSEGEVRINDSCVFLNTYDVYSAEVPKEQLGKELLKEGAQKLEFTSHTVTAIDEVAGENGAYDAVDTILLSISGSDLPSGIAQTVSIQVEYRRNAENGEWEKWKETCKKWDANLKKLGGTVWKTTTDEGEIFIRFRDTIEFVKISCDAQSDTVNEAEFATTILGAMATVTDGNMDLVRVHVIGGTLKADGTLTAVMQVNQKDEMTIVLNEFEQIEKTDTPFTEEEYKEAADQR